MHGFNEILIIAKIYTKATKEYWLKPEISLKAAAVAEKFTKYGSHLFL